MAPERPRSVGCEIPLGPRIIERKPESEFPALLRPARTETTRPGSFLPRATPQFVERESVELREPRQPGLWRFPVSNQRPRSDDFVPLPPPIVPRRYPQEEAMPILEMRSPRHPPVIHAPSPPPQAHPRRRAPSPLSFPVREVETIRIHRLANVDRSKADRRRAREIEEGARIESERRRDVENASRHPAVTLGERGKRREAERVANRAVPQRRSAEIVDAGLQRDNHRLERERRLPERRLPEQRLPEQRLPEQRLPQQRLPEQRLPEQRLPEQRLPEQRLPEREVALPFAERQRERRRARDSLGRHEDELRPAPDGSRRTREIRPGIDRGAEVIEAARLVRRLKKGERIVYYANGRRIDQGRHE